MAETAGEKPNITKNHKTQGAGNGLRKQYQCNRPKTGKMGGKNKKAAAARTHSTCAAGRSAIVPPTISLSSPKRGLAPTLGAPICVVPPAHSSLKWMLLSACTPAALGRSRCRPHLMRHPKSDRLGMSHASSHSCQFWSKFGCSSVTDPPACLCPVVNLQRLHRKSGQKDKHFALCKLRFQFSNFASLKTPFFGHFLEQNISKTFPRISEIFPFLLRYSRPPLASFRF